MGSLLQCLFHICCDDDDDDDEQNDSQHGISSQPARMARGVRVANDSNAGIYRVAPQGSTDEDDAADENAEECRAPSSDENTASIHEFFRQLRRRWRKHDSVSPVETEIDPDDALAAASAHDTRSISSPLRAADSFDSSTDVLTISAEEIVLPGSKLQQEMARAASLNLEAQDDECVICMEGFDPTNPRMPTLCGCGQNKTYFHLPCLYQWIEQSRECPSCRQKLRWEEF